MGADDLNAATDASGESAIIEIGRQILASQPFSRLVGIELDSAQRGRCVLSLAIRSDLLQHHGFVHGGALSCLVDIALTYAGATALAVPVITSEFKINYLRPALGRRLVARAEAVHTGRNQAVCRCELYALGDDGAERLCAIAQGTIVRLGEAPAARRAG